MLEVFDFDQGSPEWFAARLGIPTASEFATVMARSPGGKTDGKTRQTYMRKLAGEILTGEPMDNYYTNQHFERGKLMEDEARELYCFAHDVEPIRVGFIRDGDRGCSPDALIGAEGGLEIKTMLPHLLIEKIEADKFPGEHWAQCQGFLWVTGRKWVDLCIYWPGLPLLTKRAYREEGDIKNLAAEVERFNTELAALVARIRRYGKPSTLKADLAASVAA